MVDGTTETNIADGVISAVNKNSTPEKESVCLSEIAINVKKP